jgi:hypothetical protein
MQNQNLKCKDSSFELRFLVFSFQLLVILCLCGCSVLETLQPEGPPYDEWLSQRYNRTKLKESSSADVLTAIQKHELELLSRSTSVVAVSGQKKKGHKMWFNMVAFDENETAAKRNYLFIVDDRPNILEEPRKHLRFDCEMVLESEVLEKPYTDENARRIAILKQVLANVRRDIGEVSSDNKMLDISGMLINQALEAVLVELNSSPVLATRLSEPAGVDFSHINLGSGRIRSLVEDDIVTVKMRLGSLVKNFEKQQETQPTEEENVEQM